MRTKDQQKFIARERSLARLVRLLIAKNIHHSFGVATLLCLRSSHRKKIATQKSDEDFLRPKVAQVKLHSFARLPLVGLLFSYIILASFFPIFYLFLSLPLLRLSSQPVI